MSVSSPTVLVLSPLPADQRAPSTAPSRDCPERHPRRGPTVQVLPDVRGAPIADCQEGQEAYTVHPQPSLLISTASPIA